MLGAAIERKPKIENVNLAGGKLIREAKVIAKKKLEHFLSFSSFSLSHSVFQLESVPIKYLKKKL